MQLSYEELYERKVKALRIRAMQAFEDAASRGGFRDVPLALEGVAYDALLTWWDRPECRAMCDAMYGESLEFVPADREAEKGWERFLTHVQTLILPFFATR